MPAPKTTVLALLFFFCLTTAGFSAEPARKVLRGHVPEAVAHLTASGRLPATNQLHLAIGLPLRNQNELDELLQQLGDPGSTNYHKYLTPEEFTARFGPTEQDYQAVVQFAETNGLTVIGRHSNRVVLDMTGGAADVERAFQITLRTYRHPTEPRDFFAPDTEPSVPANLHVISVEGLSDYSLPRPAARKVASPKVRPLSFNGTGPNNEYIGNDFRNAYVPGTALNGAGQTVALLQYSDYYKMDITNYENLVGNTVGITNYVPLTNVVVSGSTPSTANNAEVALDIEMVIAMAPRVSRIIVYEKSSVSSSLLNRIATDNLARQVSSSWSVGPWSSSTAATYDNILKQMATQGQSYFQASGDSDAYTGTRPLDSGTTVPMDSPYATVVGGTTLTMNGNGAAWSSETVWNYNLNGLPNEGSGGGTSSYYAAPSWQTNVSMGNNGGSAAFRNIPDVALTADDVFVSYNNGDAGGSLYFMGTSCAAPLWAGFCALINQQSVGSTGNPSNTVGFLNPALYAIGTGTNYAACFHDVTTDNNIGTNTPGLFYATDGYDLCTGWGAPNGTNLINTLAPLALPFLISQPASRNVTNGANVAFNLTAAGQPPLNFQWLLNGTNLADTGSISGSASNFLSIAAATTNNSGNYSLVVTNAYGSITSSVAILNVGFTPAISTQPTNLTIFSGSNAVFSVTATGSATLAYQWRKNGTNLSNGAGISGATSNVLALTAVTTNSNGNYNLSVTNIFGVATSSVAVLTVVLPPAITSSSLTNRTIQCGSNNLAFTVTAFGTPPLNYQWSFDGTPVSNATNTGFSLTNLHLPNHTISVAITNLYGSLASNAVLTVQDTIVPAITLNGSNPLTLELGSAFSDPGASATDICAGAVGVIFSGSVNTNFVGTNTLTYKAGDGNGNTNTVTRTVIVHDTTPPVILWSFTNLVLAADTNCSAKMPSVTGTNYLLATDLSGTLTNSQSPPITAILLLGTNTVVITVKDASGNAAYSTNKIIVQDQTPPVITLNGGSSLFSELGHAFVDPGATASDSCVGVVAVAVSGSVNTNAVGTNTLTYTASDGNGNTNTATRTVVVRDTTPPTISWSFTNLILAADTNCSAAMPDVTGTNFILATDFSGPLAVSQTPTNNFILPLGTNAVVIAVADAFGNAAYSTNTVIVQDQTPPVILSQPQSRANPAGTTAGFGVSASACTPQTYQWLFNSSVLTGRTNSTLTLSNVTLASVGDYSVVVTASGGSSTSAVAALTVNLLASTVAFASSENPSGCRDNLNFIAAVTPTNATGAIQFFTNGSAFVLETLVAGQAASTNVSSLPRGTNLVTAVYSGDASYLSASNSLAQIVTNHPPVVAPAFYSLVAGLDLNIAVADLATNWSDADGDTLSLTAISASTNGVVVTNTVPTLFYSNPNYVDDQFVCTISDGFGGANYQIVSIVVVPQTNSTPNISGVASQPSGVSLKLNGGYGSTYILESTTDFISGEWVPVATNTLGVTGVWQFTDAQATNFTQKFYRLKLAQ
jgi:subtilase family serine protease